MVILNRIPIATSFIGKSPGLATLRAISALTFSEWKGLATIEALPPVGTERALTPDSMAKQRGPSLGS